MKRLTLLRHAKSGWDDPVARDFDRPLNAKGRRAARVMGRWLRENGFIFDHILASPALRVVETLDEAWEGYGRTYHPQYDKRIYLASAAALLDVVQEVPDHHDHVMLCGHNPGMEDLILMLVPDSADEPFRDQVEEKYPTAAVAELEFDVERWEQVKAASAHFARFVRPRDVDPALGPDVHA